MAPRRDHAAIASADMSYVKQPSPALLVVIRRQDGLATMEQLARHGFDSSTVYRRTKSQQWQRLLPTVLLTHAGAPTRRQRLIAAALWAGADSAIDGADACAWYGLAAAVRDRLLVHVVVPWSSPIRSCGFVRVRRTIGEIRTSSSGRLRYVDAATAVVVAARGAATESAAVDLLSRGLQKGLVTVPALTEARRALGDKWCGRVDAALAAVGVGVRSPAEKLNRDVILTSRVLPEPRWNQWLDLGDGGPAVCADALWDQAGMAEEVLGKRWHGWGEQFESTEARRLRMIAAGLVVAGVTPTQLRRTPTTVLRGLEQTYRGNSARGMPAGVRLIAPPTWLADRQLRGDGA